MPKALSSCSTWPPENSSVFFPGSLFMQRGASLFCSACIGMLQPSHSQRAHRQLGKALPSITGQVMSPLLCPGVSGDGPLSLPNLMIFSNDDTSVQFPVLRRCHLSDSCLFPGCAPCPIIQLHTSPAHSGLS